MPCIGTGGTDVELGRTDVKELLTQALSEWGDAKKVLVIPPDFTRFHSGSGEITCVLYELLKDRAEFEALPALGTHRPMTEKELKTMFPTVPPDRFLVHDWRGGLRHLGDVPGEFVREVSEGKVDYPIRAEVNARLFDGGYDLIISVGQVVPHEVIGMANHNKNIFVGTGGQDTINKSHFLGAAYGMERIMGRTDTAVRRVLDYAEEKYIPNLPLKYIQTAMAKDQNGRLVMRGMYIGTGKEPFLKAAEVARKVNLDLLEEPLKKCVVYLDPHEFKSTWLGNKAIYRTRMAMADDGDLLVIAPGLKEFGEDDEIDRLIRKYGYRGTPRILKMVAENPDLRNNLSAAAHLIHGSSEGRFRITYAPGVVTREEIENAGFLSADLEKTMRVYDPDELKDGFNTVRGEDIFYVSNPALGLWALKSQFDRTT